MNITRMEKVAEPKRWGVPDSKKSVKNRGKQRKSVCQSQGESSQE